MIDVRDFGADPTGATDSAAAFNNALASASNVEVFAPTGIYKIASTIAIPKGCTIHGDGRGATIIRSTQTAGKLFSLLVDDIEIRDLKIEYNGTSAGAAGAIAIYTHGVGGTDTAYNFKVTNVVIGVATGAPGGFYNGIVIDGAFGGHLTSVSVNNCESDGIIAMSAQGYWLGVDVGTNKGNGLKITVSSPVGGIVPWITGFQSFANGGWDVYTDCGLIMVNYFLNNSSLGNLYCGGSFLPEGGYVAHGNMQWAGANPFAPVPPADPTTGPYPNLPTSPAIYLDSTAPPIEFHDLHIFGPNGNAITNLAGDHKIIGGEIFGAGTGGNSSNDYGLLSTGQYLTVMGVQFDHRVKIDGEGHVLIGNHFATNSASNPAVYFVSGTKQIFHSNQVDNAGGGNSFTADAGVGLCYGPNLFMTGAVTNNATGAGTHSFPAEAGTWTPGVSFGGGSTGLTYTTHTGSYQRTGNRVALNGYIVLSNKGSSAGAARITGLPFTCRNSNDSYGAASLTLENTSFTGQYGAVVEINDTKVSLYQTSEAGTLSALTNGNFSNTSGIFFSANYRIE